MSKQTSLRFGYVLLLLVLMCGSAMARTFWVSVTGNDANPGTQSNPVRHIQVAIDSCSYSFGSDTVIVKAGTYNEHVYIPGAGSVVLKSERGAENTIINGDLNGNCIEFSFDIGDFLIEGFTITRGVPFGIYMPSNSIGPLLSPEIRNCKIIQNGSISDAVSISGGIRAEYGQPYIHHNVIKENWSNGSGAGIACIFSGARIWNNIIDSNFSETQFGAGIYMLGNYTYGSTAVVTVPPSIQNNLIRWNHSYLDGANVYVDGNSIPRIFNNLIYNGVSDIGQGGGIAYVANSRPFIMNNILAGNSPYSVDCSGASIDSTFNNCIFGNSPNDDPFGGCFFNASNLIGVNPQFVDETSYNFHLPGTSPLIDAGRYDPLLSYADFDDGNRWVGKNPDIGPYENCLLVPDFSYTPPTPCAGQPIFTAFEISGSWKTTIWSWGDGDIDTVDLGDEFAPVKTYVLPGVYNVRMTAICESDTESVSKTIVVFGKPVPLFGSSDTTICLNIPVQFSNQTIDTSATYLWRFGDGATSAEENPAHTYTTVGAKTVRLITTNACGSDSATLIVTVIDKPNASFTASATFGSAPLIVNFNGSSSQPAASWSWSFGSAGSAFQEDTSITFEQAGLYTISLTAGNECGNGTTDTRNNYIRVSGFELKPVSADTVSNNFRKVFTAVTDTILGSYSRRVNLSASVIPANPRRGRATVLLSKTQVAVPEEFTATVTLDSVLAAGDYTLRIIATSTANLPVDTISYHFKSNPVAIASLLTPIIDFDSVQIDETKTDTVSFRNVMQFPVNLTFSILDVTSAAPAFVPLVTSSPAILPGGFVKIPVRFDPEDVGEYQASLLVRTNDPVTETFTVSLHAVGISERKPPKVASTSPIEGMAQVLIGSNILIDLTEPLELSSLGLVPPAFSVKARSTGLPIEGTFEYGGASLRMTFDPTAKLPPYDTIIVTLLGTVEDLSGNSLDGNNDGLGEGSPIDDFVLKFKTGPAVYPGDCNNDGRVNEADVLPLGIFYGVTGPNRNSFAEGNSFAPKQALEWTDLRATYADANGDGEVNVSDLLVISANWDLSHPSAMPLDYSDLNLADYAEGFRQLRPALSGFAGSELGDRMMEIVNSLSGDNSVPTEFSLLQNFPNPFNPQTSIMYTLPEPSYVRVTIHNILGQTVRTLVDEQQSAGFKSILWDGADSEGRQVSSGLYFYRIESGNFVAVRKMMKLQ